MVKIIKEKNPDFWLDHWERLIRLEANGDMTKDEGVFLDWYRQYYNFLNK